MTQTVVMQAEKKHLKVTWVGTPKDRGTRGTQVLAFNCEDNLQYETLTKPLFEHIKVGAEFDADTELRKAIFDDGGEKLQWVAIQIYKDGKPVYTPSSKPAFSGGRSYGKSSEELEQSKRTMLISYAKDMVVAGKTENDADTLIKIYHKLKAVVDPGKTGLVQAIKEATGVKEETLATEAELRELDRNREMYGFKDLDSLKALIKEKGFTAQSKKELTSENVKELIAAMEATQEIEPEDVPF